MLRQRYCSRHCWYRVDPFAVSSVLQVIAGWLELAGGMDQSRSTSKTPNAPSASVYNTCCGLNCPNASATRIEVNRTKHQLVGFAI
jgi:hypothetical protein